MVLLKRATGSLEAKPQGNGGGHGKLAGVVDWIARRITEKRDLTLDELVVELRCGPGVEVHRVSVWRRLRSLDLTHKKRPARRRTEAPRGRRRPPHLDHQASAVHGQHADTDRLY